MISSTGIENSTDTPDTDTPERSSRGVLDSRRGHNEADGKQRPLDSKTVTPELSRSRLFVCFVAALIVVLFAVMGLARLNGQNLFNPDSSRYTIMAKALVDGRGYRSIDWPGEPLYGLRPPGLSVLLMPAAWIFPYNTIAAKGVVLLLGIGLIAATLWLVGMTIRRDEFRRQSLWSIVIVGLLLASNPLTLLLSTEVLSEVPYAAISVAVLLLLAVWGDRPTWPRVILIGVLLGFLPFVRTVGVTLVAAVAAWAMFRRARWQWLGSVAMAVVATAGWMLRNSQLGNRGYGSYFSETLAAGGIPAVIAKMVSGLLFYLHMWASVLVPGTLPGRSTFWLALLEGDGIAPGPTALYGFASAVIILLSLWGMCVAKKQGGAICLWYIAATLTCLAIWPFRVERYIWPLVPVTWAFVPAALMDLKERLEFRQNATARVWQGLIGLTAVLILVWQTQACAHLVAPNVRHVLEPDRFFQDEMPPLYFCDWANAGNWLREHSDPTERILSRKSDIALSSRRYVRMVNFEMLDAQTLHREIQHDRIHYLAMIGRRFGSVFDWMLRGQDPVYRYETVYDDSGVVIARITPNRNWVIHASKDLTRDDLAVATQLAEEHPDRLEAQLHWAQLLSFSNQQEVAPNGINVLGAS